MRRRRPTSTAERLTPAQRRLLALEPEPTWAPWLALTPGERLVRAWAFRARLPDPEAAHDARSLPQL